MKTLNFTQLAKHIDIEKRTLYRMIKDKRFTVEPIRGTQPRLWLSVDADKWLADR